MSIAAESSSATGLRMIDTDAEVETPECVRFRYRTAGPTRRLLAYAIDSLVRAGILLLVGMSLILSSVINEKNFAEAAFGLMLVVFFVLEWGYYVLFETLWDGKTPGKLVVRLRVVKDEGYPIRFVDSVLRNLLRAADFLPAGYALGFVSMASDRRFRRIGDRVAGTMVVVEERREVAGPVVINPPPSVQEIEAFAQRPRLATEELEGLELFLRRRATLGQAREQELAQMIAPYFAKRLGLRYVDAARFLSLLYRRATEREGRERPSEPVGRRARG